MTRFPFYGLRSRSMLLVLLVALPAFGLILYIGLADRRTEITEAQDDALRLARLAAFEEEQMIGATRQLLVTMAELPQVRSDDSAACNALMADIRKQFQRYANLGVIAANGDVICSALPISGPVNLADRDYFQRTLLGRNFAVGDYQVGRVTGVPSINFGYPIFDETGQIKAVVFAALDLDWLNRIEYEVTAQLPQGTTLTKIDTDGIILVRHPDPEQRVGQPWSETSLTGTVRTPEDSVIWGSGADGVSRVYAFSSLNSVIHGNNMRIILGIPQDILFGEANRRLALSLTGLGIVALLALAAAWIGGEVFILRPVKTLVKATGRLGAGDLNVRTGLPHDRGELGQLARAFDDMAESLGQRVAERKRAEETLRNKVAALQTLAEIDREIIAATEPHIILDLVCRRAAELMCAPKSAIAIRSAAGEMHLAASHGLRDPMRTGEEFAHFWQAGIMRRGDSSARETFSQANIPADAPYMPEFCAREEIRALALAPLAAGEQVLGTLVIFDAVPHAWSADEIQVLSLLAGQAAIGMENARLYEEARRHVQEVETLNQVGQKLTATLDVEEIVELLGREASNLLRPGNFDVILYDEARGEIEVKFYLDKRERQAGFRFPFGVGLVSYILTHKQPILAVDYLTECEKRGVKPVGRSAKAWLGVPMMAGEKALGALLVWDYEREGVFGDRDMRVLSTLAAQAAIALENARLYQGEREQRALAEALRDTAAALVSTLDFDQVLERVLTHAGQVVPHDAGTIMLDEQGVARVARSRGYAERGLASVSEVRFPIAATSNLRYMSETWRPLVVPDTTSYPGWTDLPETNWIRSYAAAPIKVKGQVVGFINLDSAASGFFTQAHAERLQAFADQAAIAIENARLYSSLQEINNQLRVALRAKDEMIQNVSHELRTPLGILYGYVEMLQDAGLGPLTAEQEQAVEIMHQQGDQLRFMVDRLLALQAFNANALQRIELDMGAWLPRILQPWEARAALRGVAGGSQLRLEIPDSLPTVSADSHFLAQAIENLLGNAVKFSPRGGEVRVRAWAEDGEVIIAVSDAGIGIPPDKLQQIFERFYQVDGSTTRRFGGMGIGLALCRAIVEAHGGRIWAESNGDGRGSTFYVALPAPTSSDTCRRKS